jgi:hypothetical protein
MTNPYRAMCAELLRSLENYPIQPPRDRDLCLRARALLAQPEPKGPTDEELVNFRNRATADCCASRSNNGANLLSGDDLVACQAAGLRAVLAKYGSTTPQLVAEGPTDEELLRLAREWNSGFESIELHFAADYARAVLAKWGHQ